MQYFIGMAMVIGGITWLSVLWPPILLIVAIIVGIALVSDV